MRLTSNQPLGGTTVKDSGEFTFAPDSSEKSTTDPVTEVVNDGSTTIMSKNSLSTQDQYDFQQHEVTIKAGLTTFLQVGEALVDIRNRRLYRTTHKTFELYCRERWNWSKTHCNRLICSVVVAGNLTPIGAKIESESHVRPLAKLDTAEQQQHAYTRATDKAKGENRKVTAKDIATAVDEESATKSTQNPDPKPQIIDLPNVTRFGADALASLTRLNGLPNDSKKSIGFDINSDYIINADKTGNPERARKLYKALTTAEQQEFLKWARRTTTARERARGVA